MKKILIVGLGGTIACKKESNISLSDNPFRILEYYDNKSEFEFEFASPFSILSENLCFENFEKIKSYFDSLDFNNYSSVFILHGSDTLAFTAAFLFNLYPHEKIILIAAGKPPGEQDSNAVSNFSRAVSFTKSGFSGVWVSYDAMIKASEITSADENDCFISISSNSKPAAHPVLKRKNILIIKPYPAINYDNYNLSAVDCVLHSMYHSATVGEKTKLFAQKCKTLSIPHYFVTAKDKLEYSSSGGIKNVFFKTTLEDAFSKLLLTN